MMKTLLTALVLILALSAARADGGFLSAVNDLPLMPGLAEVADATMMFDAPQGRIVEAYATGALEPGAVTKFYADTLPQLGWTPAGDGYERDGERLVIDFPAASAGEVTCRFTLAPVAGQ